MTSQAGQQPSDSSRSRSGRRTHAVSSDLFRQVYDSPASLPGARSWVTTDEDVRQIERLLELPARSIGAPLWVSGDSKACEECGREVNWLDIVASALERIHDRALIAKVILGDKRFVNTEVPDSIAGVVCFKCGEPVSGLRSFKCHNWAYAYEDMLPLIRYDR
jgi:hypothetical protein